MSCCANHRLACRIWEWCITHNIWLTAAHIPGIENITADRVSRVSRRETEWQLNKGSFSAAIQKIGVTPNIDLFASQLNFQIKTYISYQPDPYGMAVNAFSLSWADYTFYDFQYHSTSGTKNFRRESCRVNHSALLAYPNMGAISYENVAYTPNHST